jgi:two-component system chemotaxis response regulator CheB
MANPFRLIVIGASGGGVEALQRVLRDLPADLPAAIAVVLHTHATSPQFTADILGQHTDLQVAYAVEEEEIAPGRVYLAPPDRHLLVRWTRRLGLDAGPKVNFHRPAADPLFASAARVFGRQVTGVVLSGGDGDGSTGLQEIKKHGGTCVVQSPSDAKEPSMPANAILRDSPDHVVMLDRLGPLLRSLVTA